MRERIKMVRKSLNLTQAEFSIALGLAPTSAANWEKKAAQEPTESIKMLICKTFNVDRNWLETGEGEMFVKTESWEKLLEGLPEEQKELIRGVMSLPPEMQQSFLNIMRNVSKEK